MSVAGTPELCSFVLFVYNRFVFLSSNYSVTFDHILIEQQQNKAIRLQVFVQRKVMSLWKLKSPLANLNKLLCKQNSLKWNARCLTFTAQHDELRNTVQKVY